MRIKRRTAGVASFRTKSLGMGRLLTGLFLLGDRLGDIAWDVAWATAFCASMNPSARRDKRRDVRQVRQHDGARESSQIETQPLRTGFRHSAEIAGGGRLRVTVSR